MVLLAITILVANKLLGRGMGGSLPGVDNGGDFRLLIPPMREKAIMWMVIGLAAWGCSVESIAGRFATGVLPASLRRRSRRFYRRPQWRLIHLPMQPPVLAIPCRRTCQARRWFPHPLRNHPQSSPAEALATQLSFPADKRMTVGTLVAEVNGSPIYANKILRLDAAIFSATKPGRWTGIILRYSRALRVQQDQGGLIYDELEIAAAQQTLDPKDLNLAWQLTRLWRQRQIDEAGGSLEVARRRFASQGQDFDEVVEDTHRTYLQQLYYVRKVEPAHCRHCRRQTPVLRRASRRRYFPSRNRRTWTFWKSIPAAVGSRDLATQKILHYQELAKNGGDFHASLIQYSTMSVFQKTVPHRAAAHLRLRRWTRRSGTSSRGRSAALSRIRADYI